MTISLPAVKENRPIMLLKIENTSLLLLAAGLLACSSISCTSTSNLSAFSQSNIQAVNRIAKETEKEEAAPAGEPVSIPATSNDLTPKPEPAPEEKKVEEVKAPFTLASVPLTSVESQPTNQVMMVRTTAYSHLQADSLPYGRLSAAGNTLQYGEKIRSAAADWSKFPMGTRFVIEGLPYEYIIDDYGSALTGTKTIDIYKPNLAGIGQWGARNVPIRVIEWGSFEESRKILDGRKHVRHAHHVRKMLSEIEKRGEAGYLKKSTGGSA
ncbi:MAG: 3D domain-containing protein [Verrucomicrobiales bacterium]|nr:3D domain-containing protein [Verrucomicrobiales bacterium]